MKFTLLEFDNEHYASDLVQADELLKWDIKGNTHYLIIRGDFGSNIVFTKNDKADIEKIGKEKILSGKEICYADNRFFVFMQKQEYAKSYNITVSPARYAVFCCEYNTRTDVCKLYVPNEACQYQCDVYSNVVVNINHEEIKKGFLDSILNLFKRKPPERDYHIVKIQNIPGYSDGSLQYKFDGCKYEYPITKAMLDKPVYIPSFNLKPPRIESALGNGYKIITHLQKGDEH